MGILGSVSASVRAQGGVSHAAAALGCRRGAPAPVQERWAGEAGGEDHEGSARRRDGTHRGQLAGGDARGHSRLSAHVVAARDASRHPLPIHADVQPLRGIGDSARRRASRRVEDRQTRRTLQSAHTNRDARRALIIVPRRTPSPPTRIRLRGCHAASHLRHSPDRRHDSARPRGDARDAPRHRRQRLAQTRRRRQPTARDRSWPV